MRLALFLLAALTASGQTFEVASIRPAAPGARRQETPPVARGQAMPIKDLMGMISRADGVESAAGSVIMRGTSLAAMIKWAYMVEEYQVTGPTWLSSTRFDIVAKSPGPAAVPELRLMMQALLKDRFKLELHRSTKEMSTYVVSVGKNGPKFKASQTDGPGMVKQVGMAGISGVNVEVADLLTAMAQVLRAPVVNQTGLTGKYDISVDVMSYASEMAANFKPGDAPPDPATIIAQVLQEQFGLKLESKKAPVEILVVDKAEKTPTEN